MLSLTDCCMSACSTSASRRRKQNIHSQTCEVQFCSRIEALLKVENNFPNLSGQLIDPVPMNKSRYRGKYDNLVIQYIKYRIHLWERSHLWGSVRDEWYVCCSELILSEPHYC